MLKAPPQAQVIDVPNEGYIKFLNKQVEIRCNVYIYTGILTGVNEKILELENPAIVYETGPHGDSKYKDVQGIPGPTFINMGLIESASLSFKTYEPFKAKPVAL